MKRNYFLNRRLMNRLALSFFRMLHASGYYLSNNLFSIESYKYSYLSATGRTSL